MTDEPDEQLVELAHQMFDLARAGDAERLAAYVEAGVPVDLTDASGNTLLMLAAYHGHAATVVTGWPRRGADVDRVNDRGQSPLAGAVFKDEHEVVRALLAAGADPDAGSPTRPGDRGDVRPAGPVRREDPSATRRPAANHRGDHPISERLHHDAHRRPHALRRPGRPAGVAQEMAAVVTPAVRRQPARPAARLGRQRGRPRATRRPS